MSRVVRVRIDFKSTFENVEIDEGLSKLLAKSGQTPEQYAHDVAQERLADKLRDGEAFDLVYPLASFKALPGKCLRVLPTNVECASDLPCPHHGMEFAEE